MTHITIRPLSKEYVEILRKWRNENRRFFIDQRAITKKAQKEWFEHYRKNQDEKIYIVFCKKKPVGCLSATKLGEEVEIGRMMLGEKRFGRRGIMGDALELVLSRFENRRISLRVLKDNYPAILFYKKHKFKIVGSEKNYYIMERRME